MKKPLQDKSYIDKGNVLVKTDHDSNSNTEQISEVVLKEKRKNNKNVIQSHILTVAKYDFSVYEKRILYRIVDCFQYQLKGKKLDKNFSIDKTLHGDIDITLPLSFLLKNKENENYDRVKKALYSLPDKKISYEINGMWTVFTLIERPTIFKYKRTIQLRLHQEVYEALLNFIKGWHKYELEMAMTFRNVYTMRFYELLSNQKKPITYSIDSLRTMFQLDEKYKLVSSFIKYVIISAKKELAEKAPFSFTYEVVKGKERTGLKGGRRKITAITFIPVYSKHQNKNSIPYKQWNFDLLEVLTQRELDSLLDCGFTEQELKNNYKLFKEYKEKAPPQTIERIIMHTKKYPSNIRGTIQEYIIGSMKKELNKNMFSSLDLSQSNRKSQPTKKPTNIIEESKPSNIQLNSSKHNMIQSEIKEEPIIQPTSSFEKEEEIDNDFIHSFLEITLGIPKVDLDKVRLVVAKNGGRNYLNQLILSYKRDLEEIKKKIFIEISKFSSSKEDKSETILFFLESILSFPKVDLDKAKLAIIQNGGEDYIKQLFVLCKGNTEEIKKKLLETLSESII